MSHRPVVIMCSLLLLGGCTKQARMSWKAERGDPKSMYEYGDYLTTKRPNNYYKDFEEGKEWIRRAAEAGYPQAMYSMGGLCQTGKSLEEDSRMSSYWYIRAAEAGDVNAMVKIAQGYLFGHPGYPKDKVKSDYWYARAEEIQQAKLR